jgi:uncharacterized protein YciI
MLFVVIFTDHPGRAHIRDANLQAHIEWLEQHRDVVPVGGSLRVKEGDFPRGGLWIAEAESKAQVEAMIQRDPFFMSGLRASCEIFHWSKANPDRKELI